MDRELRRLGRPGSGPGGAGPRIPDPRADEVITCIDCGGRAHLITHVDPEDPLQPGDLITYRCADCNDRWDLIVPDDEE